MAAELQLFLVGPWAGHPDHLRIGHPIHKRIVNVKLKAIRHSLCTLILGGFVAVNTASAETLVSVGSDTLEHLMSAWSAEFKKQHPGVEFDLTAAGSSTAPPALVDGRSHFGPMSRKMKPEEIKAFETKYGYKPTAVRVALDALAVFAHKDNPVSGMSLEQVDAVFSATRKCGAGATVSDWGDLGVMAGTKIALYGRDSNSGTHGYFKKKALCKGDYADAVEALKSSDAIVEKVAAEPNAIGYSGIGYARPGVRAIPLTKKAGGDFVEATPDNAVSGKYPLARFLYVYVNKKPGEALPQVQADFLRLVLSETGQKIVADHGFIALPEKTMSKEVRVAQM